MRRRDFLKNICALSALGAIKPTAAADGLSPLDLKVGIISDIHLSRPAQHKSQGAIDTFVKTLAFFKDEGVDAVLLAGDLTNGGTADELKITVECWEKVFGGLSAGPAKVFVTGNHENNYSKEAKERWRAILQEPDDRFFVKRVKGYSFVGAHWAAWTDEKALRAFLAEHRSELAPDKPFFYVQHAHPQHTCYGDWIWHRPDGGPTDKVLADYPNAVAFSGHTHYPITDQRSIWQGAFTSIGTASLRWLSMPKGRENSESAGKQTGSRMSYEFWCAQGMIMEVCGEKMVFRRYDLDHMEKLGDDWDVRVRHAKDDPTPFAFAERAARHPAPEFPADAKITLTRRQGKNPQKEQEEQVVLTFPAAVGADDVSRVFDYEVRAEYAIDDVVCPICTKRVYSQGAHWNVKREAKTARCVFGVSELPERPFRFAVTPLNSYGKRGRTIVLKQNPKDWEK